MMTPFRQCACGCTRFAPGPRGGASWNVACLQCGHRFNLALLAGEPAMLVNDIGPGEQPAGAAPWIIELEAT